VAEHKRKERGFASALFLASGEEQGFSGSRLIGRASGSGGWIDGSRSRRAYRVEGEAAPGAILGMEHRAAHNRILVIGRPSFRPSKG
jgi:hypothetical protein